MQDKNRSHSLFSQRTERLAECLGLQLGDLPAIIAVSPRMFYGYRSGAYPITEKALRKLELAENRAFGATEKPMEDLTFRSESQATAVRPSKSLTVEQRLERIELVLERIAESLEAAGKSKQG